MDRDPGRLGWCHAFELAGLSLPASVLAHPRVRRAADMLPIVMLAALVAVQTLTAGEWLRVAARLVGLGAATVARVLRAPFPAVVAVGALAAAVVRLV